MEQLFDLRNGLNGVKKEDELLHETPSKKNTDPFRNDPYGDVIITVNEMRMWASGKLIRPRSLL